MFSPAFKMILTCLEAEQILGGWVVLPVEPVEDSRKIYTLLVSTMCALRMSLCIPMRVCMEAIQRGNLS